ncbi:MAG: hypothetical protein LUC93_14660 [Planctomycetaceae bacterium]|nr:hypothetical protein [Planctomycetaceae bacterium]
MNRVGNLLNSVIQPVRRDLEPAGRSSARPVPASAPLNPSAEPRFELIPEKRPDLSGIERPRLADLLDDTLRPAFLRTKTAQQLDFVAGLRAASLRLGERTDKASLAGAAAVREALAEKETLEACRLLLVKG